MAIIKNFVATNISKVAKNAALNFLLSARKKDQIQTLKITKIKKKLHFFSTAISLPINILKFVIEIQLMKFFIAQFIEDELIYQILFKKFSLRFLVYFFPKIIFEEKKLMKGLVSV